MKARLRRWLRDSYDFALAACLLTFMIVVTVAWLYIGVRLL